MKMAFSFDISKHAGMLWHQLLTGMMIKSSLSPLVELPLLVLMFQLLMMVELVCFGRLDCHLLLLL
jgi:hypothetical protein